MTLFNNKYRIESARLKHWDYSNNGMYFITICTNTMKNYFGKIVDGKVILNKFGKYVEHCWIDIPKHSKYVELDEFVIMPNHIHGIIGIDNPNDSFSNNDNNVVVETRHALSNNKNSTKETGHALSLQHPRFRNQGKNSISAMVGSFKSAVTKYANKNNIPFKWQSRFYDHVIRDEKELNNIREYIISNPEQWKKDKYYQQ